MNVAVVGMGRMGRRHIQAVRSIGLSVCGISDINPDSVASAGSEYGIGVDRQFATLESMLQRTKPECLIVATTAPSHAEYTEAAAKAGVKFIFCEKPMAISLDQCDRMMRVCQSHGAQLAINHQMRFMEQFLMPKRIIESETFGGLSSVTVVGGNFGLSMNGLHYFEMFRFMTDELPREVTAWFSNEKVPNPRGAQFVDQAGAVRIVTPSGKRLYLDCWSNQGHGVQTIYAGPFGQLRVDELAGEMTLSVRDAADRALPTTRYGTTPIRSTGAIPPAEVIESSAAVLRSLVEEKDYPDGETGRLAVAVLVAAYQSHERGHVAVDLQRDTLPRDRVFAWA
jgi:myo-inositol 2-dehydrogenase / D-chiro-inositol 1-dehydrogenase